MSTLSSVTVTGHPCVGVDLEVDGLHLAELAKILGQLLLARLPAQPAHEQLLLALRS